MWWWLLNRCTSTNISLTFPNSEDALWPSAHALVLCRSPQIHHICNYRRKKNKTMKVKKNIMNHCSLDNIVCTVHLRTIVCFKVFVERNQPERAKTVTVHTHRVLLTLLAQPFSLWLPLTATWSLNILKMLFGMAVNIPATANRCKEISICVKFKMLIIQIWFIVIKFTY